MSLRGTFPCVTRVTNYVLCGWPRMRCSYLSSGLVETEVVPQLFLTDGTRGINLVTQDKERNLGELLNRQ